jgi:hypothetical protein
MAFNFRFLKVFDEFEYRCLARSSLSSADSVPCLFPKFQVTPVRCVAKVLLVVVNCIDCQGGAVKYSLIAISRF